MRKGKGKLPGNYVHTRLGGVSRSDQIKWAGRRESLSKGKEGRNNIVFRREK